MSNNTEDTGKATSHQIDSRVSCGLGEVVRNSTFTFMQEYER